MQRNKQRRAHTTPSHLWEFYYSVLLCFSHPSLSLSHTLSLSLFVFSSLPVLLCLPDYAVDPRVLHSPRSSTCQSEAHIHTFFFCTHHSTSNIDTEEILMTSLTCNMLLCLALPTPGHAIRQDALLETSTQMKTKERNVVK